MMSFSYMYNKYAPTRTVQISKRRSNKNRNYIPETQMKIYHNNVSFTFAEAQIQNQQVIDRTPDRSTACCETEPPEVMPEL